MTVKKPHGFTVIELAISLLILGITLGGALTLYDRAQDFQKHDITRKNMRAVVVALSRYAETAGRIPCPAAPNGAGGSFGWERPLTENDLQLAQGPAPVGSCRGAGENVGLVPFMTLNLSPKEARDGWGNYLTYAVSPIFTQNNDPTTFTDAGGNPAKDNDSFVHARCRTAEWLFNAGTAQNISPVKARFCCIADNSRWLTNTGPAFIEPATDLRLQLYSDPGRDLLPRVRPSKNVIAVYDASYKAMNDVAKAGDGSHIPHTEMSSVLTSAIILVSHGMNGYGAYLADGTANKRTIAAPSAAESENQDGNSLFYTGSRQNTPHFDDLVIGMTQDGLMAAGGVSSCQFP